MNKFIKQLTLFVLIFAMYIGINFCLNLYIINITRPQVLSNQIIIAGDSHPQTAIDPQILGDSSNVSQEGEPYFFTYHKLKNLSSNNKILILGFSYHNLSGFNDKKFIDSKWSNNMFQRTYPIISIIDFNEFEIDKLTYLKVLYKNMCVYPKWDHHTNYIGGFTLGKNNSNLMNYDSDAVVDRHFYYKGKNLEESSASIKYLNLIINTAEKNNTKVILIVTPLHTSYLDNVPGSFINELEKNKSEILSKYKNVEIWDYSEEFTEDKFFLNSDHLNNIGARKFTELIKKRLEKYLQNTD